MVMGTSGVNLLKEKMHCKLSKSETHYFVEWMIAYFIVFICIYLYQLILLLCSGEKCVDFCVKLVPFIFLDSILVTSLFLFCLCAFYKPLNYA